MKYAAYPIFAALALVSFVWLSRWLRRPGVSPWAPRGTLLGAVLILLCGFAAMQGALRNQRETTSASLLGMAEVFARETGRLKHAEIVRGRPDSPYYVNILKTQKDWLMANADVDAVYTLRKLPLAGIVQIVRTERDGQWIKAGTEARSPSGEPHPSSLQPLMERAFAGKSAISPEPYSDPRGSWVTALVPLRNSADAVEGIIGVDFSAATWPLLETRARAGFIALTTIALLLHAIGTLVAIHRQALRLIAQQREGLSTLEIEHGAIDEIVNSIDAIVWEWDVTARRFSFISSQVELILGYEEQTWLQDAELWRQLLHPDDKWADEHFDELIDGGRPYTLDYRMIARDGRTVWIRETGLICRSLSADGHHLARGCMRDISAEKAREIDLQTAHSKLVEHSRRAGMAEVATGVLHNVGNVLNGVNVSGDLIVERLRHSRVSDLIRVSEMVCEHRERLPLFVESDPRGRLLPELLCAVADQLVAEHEELLLEVGQISERIEHIKDIVSVQQNHARTGGLVEPREMVELIEDALKLNDHPLRRAQVRVAREYEEALPRTLLDRHLVLQILVNLIRNAIDAIEAAAPAEPCIVVGARIAGLGTTLQVSVADNGIGVSPENLQPIFSHGFTTKRHGHGFGLHSGAIAAAAMGGSLTAESAGPRCGATFVLEIPINLASPDDSAGSRDPEVHSVS